MNEIAQAQPTLHDEGHPPGRGRIARTLVGHGELAAILGLHVADHFLGTDLATHPALLLGVPGAAFVAEIGDVARLSYRRGARVYEATMAGVVGGIGRGSRALGLLAGPSEWGDNVGRFEDIAPVIQVGIGYPLQWYGRRIAPSPDGGL